MADMPFKKRELQHCSYKKKTLHENIILVTKLFAYHFCKYSKEHIQNKASKQLPELLKRKVQNPEQSLTIQLNLHQDEKG